MKSIFDATAYNEIVDRINGLKEESQGQWGKMTVGQMVWHCQIPVKVAIDNKITSAKGNLFIRWFFKKSLYNDKPWRKNLPTISAAKTTETKDLTTERRKLITMLQELYEARDRTTWNPHPIFGTFTAEQWGKMEYKHLDHHLTQFGV